MLHDALVAESRRNDSLDEVRTAALDRVRWLVDLLERQRTEFRQCMGHEHRRSRAAGAATQAEIDGRCTLDGRFLIVRGELRTYKIHLGSANILMQPDDSYLCIVPARRSGDGKVFLPFEDDRLSLILSKAFLLAADTEITDASILTQIKRGA
ncbi:hypothetical protein ACFTY8_15565 [Streptomyces mirabilis]|uniref:DUF7737 domain-containing protein n=1 Tax=Streptomyces mirabilis TaxID=68239 RepID=UPI00362D379B